MKKSKVWGILGVIGLLIVAAVWWITSDMMGKNDPLDPSDAFVYKNHNRLYWFVLTKQNGKVKGTLHQKQMKEESGKVPFIVENKWPLTAIKTNKGYKFKVYSGQEMKIFVADFSGNDLLVKEQGQKNSKVYKGVNNKKLDGYENALQKQLQAAAGESEQKENERINTFFTELNNIYGFLYTAEDGSDQLFFKVDEALREGEVSGSLQVMDRTKNKGSSYKESQYAINGITDGLMMRLYTTVDGKEVKMNGNFHGDAAEFDLSYWKTNRQLTFHAVTEEAYNRSYQEFKNKQK